MVQVQKIALLENIATTIWKIHENTPCLIGESTRYIAIFNSYVDLPEGIELFSLLPEFVKTDKGNIGRSHHIISTDQPKLRTSKDHSLM